MGGGAGFLDFLVFEKPFQIARPGGKIQPGAFAGGCRLVHSGGRHFVALRHLDRCLRHFSLLAAAGGTISGSYNFV